jgi:histidinol-phosphate/aromatic aminotransferase/cobyric acid decarboxylase-like protein
LPKWNLNSLAEAVVFMIADHAAEYRESLRLLSRDRALMAEALAYVPGLTVFPSQGNFLLVKLPVGWSGVELRDYLVANHGIFVRECGNKLGITSQFLRFVVRPQEDVTRLVDGMFGYMHMLQEMANDTSGEMVVHHLPTRSSTRASGTAVVRRHSAVS